MMSPPPSFTDDITKDITTTASICEPAPVPEGDWKRCRWIKLDEAIDRLVTQKSIESLSYEELYRSAYELVTKGHGDYLYSQLHIRMKTIFENVAQSLHQFQLGESSDGLRSDHDFLAEYVNAIAKLRYTTSVLTDVLLYMERKYCEPKRLPLLEEIAGANFRVILFETGSNKELHIGKRIITSFGNLVQNVCQSKVMFPIEKNDANMEIISTIQLLRNVVKTLSTFRSGLCHRMFYQQALETPLYQHLMTTEEQNTHEKDTFLKNHGPLKYIQWALENSNRVKFILTSIRMATSIDLFIRGWEDVYVKDRFEDLFDSEDLNIAKLYDERNIELAKGVFLFWKNCREYFGRWIMEKWEPCVFELFQTTMKDYDGNGRKSLQKLFELRQNLLIFAKKSFQDDAEILQAIHRAFLSGLNDSDQVRHCLVKGISQQLRLCSMLLVKAAQFKEQAADWLSGVKETLNRWINTNFQYMFRGLADKDKFEIEYRNAMARRLSVIVTRELLTTDLNGWWKYVEEIEHTAIKSLADECGRSYTHNLSMLLDDVTSSVGALRDDMGTMSVVIICNMRWSENKSAFLQSAAAERLSPLNELVNTFQTTYTARYHNRKLEWMLFEGTMIIKVNRRSADKNRPCVYVGASTMQGLIMLLMNSRRQWTHEQLLSSILDSANGFSQCLINQFNRNLAGLHAPRSPILTRLQCSEERNGFQTSVVHYSPNLEFSCEPGTLFLTEPIQDHVRLARSLIGQAWNMSLLGSKPTEIPTTVPVKTSLSASCSLEDSLTAVQKDDINRQFPEEDSLPLATSSTPSSGTQPFDHIKRQLVEAAIVREMKSRQSMGHEELYAFLNDQLDAVWKLSKEDVKQRIENLIGRDYLVRDDNDYALYHYKA